MKNPFFSIVIPAYNRLEQLERAVTSCLNQTFQDYEIIVVDDCSKTDLSRILTTFPQVKLIRADKNVGGGGARNIGIDEAIGKYIVFLDSDDEFLPNKLEIVYSKIVELGSSSDNVLFYSKVSIDRGVGRNLERPYLGIKKDDHVLSYIFEQWGLITTSTIAVPSEMAKKIKFDSTLRRHQDYDFVFRWQLSGGLFAFIDLALVINHDVIDPTRITQSTGYPHSLFWFSKISSQLPDTVKNAFKARVLSGMHPNICNRIFYVTRSFFGGSNISKKEHFGLMIKAISPKLYSRLCTIYIAMFTK